MSAFSGLSLVCHCLPTCVPVLDGMPAFPKSCIPLSPIVPLLVYPCLQLSPIVSHCLQLSPIVSPHVCLCWMVRLPEVLFFIVSHCLPMCLCWMVLPPSQGLVSPCLPFSPHMCACVGWCLCLGWCVRLPAVLSPLVCLCWMVCPPSRRFVSPCLLTCAPVLDGLSTSPRSFLHLPLCPPNCIPIVSHCLPFCLPISPCLRLRAIVSHCLPTRVPVLDGVSPFRGLVTPCLPLSPHMCACVGWCVRLPEVLSPLSPSLSPSLSSFLSPNLSFFLFPFVAGGLILHFCPNSVRLGVLNAFSCHVFDPVPQKHVLSPPTVWGLRWCNLVTASGFVSRSFPLVVLAGGWLSSRIRRTRFATVSALISQH